MGPDRSLEGRGTFFQGSRRRQRMGRGREAGSIFAIGLLLSAPGSYGKIVCGDGRSQGGSTEVLEKSRVTEDSEDVNILEKRLR